MNTTNIVDLPTEIFTKCIFKYLRNIEIYTLGESGSKRLKAISADIVGLGKFLKLIEIMLYLTNATKYLGPLVLTA